MCHPINKLILQDMPQLYSLQDRPNLYYTRRFPVPFTLKINGIQMKTLQFVIAAHLSL